MKLKLLVFFFSFCITAGAQPGFQKYFSAFTDYQKISISSSDNTYVIAGSEWSEGSFYDFCAIKVDKNGKILWSKKFPSPNDEFLSGLSISPSGDILLSGHKSNSTGEYDFSLLRLNASGEVQWYKTYGTNYSEMSSFAGEITSSGDFFLSGNREVNQRPMVIKTNNSGTVLWSKTFGTMDGAEESLGASVTKDGGMVVFGVLPERKNFLMKINPDGTTAWTNSYASQHPQFLSSIKQTGDGGFILASSDYRCDSIGCHSHFSFIKLDPNGNKSWAKAVEGDLGVGRSAIENSDGGFTLTGHLKDSGYNKSVLIKTNSNGDLLWAKSYGVEGSFGESFFVEQTPDNGYVLLGVEGSKTSLIKTDASGNSSCNEKTLNPVLSNMNFAKSGPISLPEITDTEITTPSACTDIPFVVTDSLICIALGTHEIYSTDACVIYPNPFSGSATIELIDYRSPVTGLEFNMYDIFGRKAMQLPVNNHRLLISRGDLPSGMYFYEIRSREKIIGKGKLIAE